MSKLQPRSALIYIAAIVVFVAWPLTASADAFRNRSFDYSFGNRIDIPQPGSFTHFHWITSTSSDPRAGTVPPQCDKIDAGQLEDQQPTAVDVICPGWFLEIKAVKKFAFDHGGEIVPVSPGIDNTTHLNLVTNYQAVPAITSTRP